MAGMKAILRSKLIWGMLVGMAIGYADGRMDDEIRYDGRTCDCTVRGLWWGAGLGLVAGLIPDALPKRKSSP